MSDTEPVNARKTFRLPNSAAMVLMIALAAAAYWPSVDNGFVTDDHKLISTRAGIFESPGGLKQLIGNVYWWGTGDTDVRHDLYRPWVSWTLWADYRWSDGSPSAFHWSNYLLHLANIGLVYLCLAPAAGSGIALVVSALFGIGPAAVTSVGWISGRTDLWAMFFILLFLWLFSISARKKSWGFLAAAAASFFLALASKELAVIAPILAWVLYLSSSASSEHAPQRAKHPLWHYLLLIIPLTVYLLLRYQAVGAVRPRTTAVGGSWITPLWNVPEQILRTAFGIIFPVRYGYYSELIWSSPGSRGIFFIVGWLVFLALCAVILIGLKKRKLWAAGGLWFGITLLPVYAAGQSWAPLSDFYAYLGIPGLWLMVVDGLRDAATKLAPKLPAIRAVFIHAALIVVMMIFGILSFVRLPNLQSDFTLASAVIAAEPHSARAMMGMGEEYFRRGDGPQGEQLMRRAAMTDPKNIEPWKKCAAFYLSQGDVHQAALFVDTLSVLAPKSVDALALIARFYYEAGHCGEAVMTFQQAFKADFPTSAMLFDYGMALLCIGQDSAAVQVYQLAIQQRPFWPEALTNLGLALSKIGQYNPAADAYRQAVQQDSKNYPAWEGLATISLRLSDLPEARRAANAYLQLSPPPDEAERLRSTFSQAGVALNE